MDQELRRYMEKQTKKLMEAPLCCPEAKEAAQAWLDAEGTDREADVLQKYIIELKEDITPIDGLITFAGSPAGAGFFGKKEAQEMLSHAKEIKKAGALYCDCEACAASAAILSKKSALL